MYIGRFAPSPTGPLHFGSLLAAVGSYLESRSRSGLWLVRMEDLDPPREVAGSATDILRTLEAFGFEWDGGVMYQSSRSQAYGAVLTALHNRDLLYACTCTRKKIVAEGRKNAYGVAYAGTCRNPENRSSKRQSALRLRTENQIIKFNDRVQGDSAQNIEQDIGDFMLKRRDGLYAYHLAVVVDDAEQGISDIVRGYDLLDSTHRQIYLQDLLDLPTPQYAHLPIAINKQGQKLSKQTHAKRVDKKYASRLIWEALHFLGQQPDHQLKHESLNTIWQWGFKNWQLKKVPKIACAEFTGLNNKHFVG